MIKTTITARDRPRAAAWLYSALDTLRDGVTYELTLKERRKKRTMSANAYAWVLIDKLAEYYGLPPEYIYRRSVKQIGGNAVYVTVDPDAENDTVRVWESRGLGWVAERVTELKHSVELRLTYGSSAYDSHQMSQLIDNLIQECQTAGIETMSEKELQSLIEQWNGKE